MKGSLTALLAFGAVFAAAPADAAVVDAKEPILITTVVLGSLGGITTSIGAIVYAFEGRAFDDGWIVGSLFSSAVCGSMAVAFGANASQYGTPAIVGFIIFTTLTAWPMYWTIKTSISDVDPGQTFAVDPIAGLDASSRPSTGAVIIPALAFSF